MIEEYEEDALVQEGAPDLPATDFADTPPAQGKPRCITHILNDVHFMETTCIDISTFES